MILQKILRFAEEDLARVELEIRQQLSSEVDRIGEIGRYLLLSGGKRIRPILLLLTAKLAGYSGDRIFPLSAMIEFDEDDTGPNPPRLFVGGDFDTAGGVPAADFARLDLDVGRLPSRAAERLVDHHARMRERVTTPSLASAEQERAHAGRLAEAERAHRTAHVLHGVVDREAGRHHTAG